MHPTEDTLFHGIVALFVVAWFVHRQLVIKRIGRVRMVLPLILVLIGLVPPGPVADKPPAITLLGVSLMVSVIMGYVRGLSMRVWVDQTGQAWRQGTMLTLTLWLATIAFRVVIELAQRFAFHLDLRPGAIWLSLAVTIGVQAIVTHNRANGERLSTGQLSL